MELPKLEDLAVSLKEALAAVTPSTILQSFCCLARSRMYYFHPPTPTQMQKQQITTGVPTASKKTQHTKAAERLLRLGSRLVKSVGEACRDAPSDVASLLQSDGEGLCNVLSLVARSELLIFASGASGTLSLLASLGPQ